MHVAHPPGHALQPLLLLLKYSFAAHIGRQPFG
jgi:hypothetical protein